MDFGLQFFPDVGPDQKSAAQYWNECLDLVGLCDALDFRQIRTVEHYFEPYGGYSPSPLVFLTAASQRSRNARLITGAVLPVFNNPLKIAGEIGMIDAISDGRIDCGFGRAFLPHEFERFGRSMDESRARYDEGVQIIRLLLEEENVSFEGQFHSFKNVTSLPRPTQQPRPPIWTAALGTPQSIDDAARKGDNLMLVAFAGPGMRPVLDGYREAWKKHGHEGDGKVSISFHMFCHQDRDEARRIAEPNVMHYFESLVAAMEVGTGWGKGASSKDYPNYEKHTQKLRETTFEGMLDEGSILCGTPDDIRRQLQDYIDVAGAFEGVSMQVNFHKVTHDQAAASMRLFSERVMPHFQAATAPAAE